MRNTLYNITLLAYKSGSNGLPNLDNIRRLQDAVPKHVIPRGRIEYHRSYKRHQVVGQVGGRRSAAQIGALHIQNSN
jgi:hypothetical protein